jgi:hypothetical protein
MWNNQFGYEKLTGQIPSRKIAWWSLMNCCTPWVGLYIYNCIYSIYNVYIYIYYIERSKHHVQKTNYILCKHIYTKATKFMLFSGCECKENHCFHSSDSQFKHDDRRRCASLLLDVLGDSLYVPSQGLGRVGEMTSWLVFPWYSITFW